MTRTTVLLAATLLSLAGCDKDPCDYVNDLHSLRATELYLHQDCGDASICRVAQPLALAWITLDSGVCLQSDAQIKAALNETPMRITSNGADIGGGGDTPGQRDTCLCRPASSSQVTLKDVGDGLTLALPDREIHWPAPREFLKLDFPDGQPVRPGDRVVASFLPSQGTVQLTIGFERTSGSVYDATAFFPLGSDGKSQDFRIPEVTSEAIRRGLHPATLRLNGTRAGCEGLEDCSLSIDLQLSFDVQVD